MFRASAGSVARARCAEATEKEDADCPSPVLDNNRAGLTWSTEREEDRSPPRDGRAPQRCHPDQM